VSFDGLLQEAYRGSSRADPLTDVWAIGALPNGQLLLRSAAGYSVLDPESGTCRTLPAGHTQVNAILQSLNCLADGSILPASPLDGWTWVEDLAGNVDVSGGRCVPLDDRS
jgi:hypothetical protein